MPNLDAASLGSMFAAIGGLGTAAFGLVDACKSLPGGGISSSGFSFVERSLQKFFTDATRKRATGDIRQLVDTLHGNWINGVALADQKAIAKSLIKLRLTAGNAKDFADATNVDPTVLIAVAQKMASGTPFATVGTPPASPEANVWGRFDLALSAILDDGFQHADQRYRNTSKIAAMFMSTLLAFSGGWSLFGDNFLGSSDMAEAVIVGLLATPLAPITKDLASALAAGVKVAQAMKK